MFRTLFTTPRGSAMVATLLLLVMLAAVGGASMLFSAVDLKATSHYATGNQALYTAESGIQHALSSMNVIGVLNFNNDVVQRWNALYGDGTKTVPGYSMYSYQVTVAANAADPMNLGTITSTGSAPLQAQRTVRVVVRRTGIGAGTGAIHLAADTVTSQFDGNSFLVDGNDHDQFGTLKAGGIARPGISTRNDAVTSTVTNSLSSTQMDNIQGAGFSLNPLTPSVLTTGGPSTDDLNRMYNEITTVPGVYNDNSNVFNNGTTSTFGTLASPQITRLTNTDVTVNGNITGAGILIADGSVNIKGTIDFIGWIIVRGSTIIHTQTADGTTVLGNAVIRGSLWTADFDVQVGGSALVQFCEECLSLMENAGTGGTIPRPMQVTSWSEL